MTLEDIHAIYDGAYVEFQKSPVGGWSAAAAERYALRRVVEALRDEMRAHENIDTYVLDEILASDGGSMGPSEVGGRAAVAEAPARPGDTRPVGSTTPVAAPVCPDCHGKKYKPVFGGSQTYYVHCFCKSEAAR